MEWRGHEALSTSTFWWCGGLEVRFGDGRHCQQFVLRQGYGGQCLTSKNKEKGSHPKIEIAIERFMSCGDYPYEHEIDDLLSHPACRGVEEVHIEAYSTFSSPLAGCKNDGPTSMPDSHIGYYKLSFGSVPSHALRELHITNCNNLESPPPAAFFPFLAVLQLQSCAVSLDSLQGMIVASPQLDNLHLDYVYIKTEVYHPADDYHENDWSSHFRDDYRADSTKVQSLGCPTVSILALVNCCYAEDFTFELDAPRVRYFKYSGNAYMFPLKSPPTDLRRADLEVLKLKFVCLIEDIAVPEKKRHDELLGDMLLSNLKQLEVDGKLKHSLHAPQRSDGGDDENHEVIDIPGLSDKWFNFNCMQFYLKRVSLQFHLKKSNSFGVHLAKFFMEKAMVLEELYIDDGNHKMCEHMNRKFGGRITNPLQRCPHYKVLGGISQEAAQVN
ncbi:hypothetical protein EJB05_54763, partial [Eragrostis curvula]